MKQLLITIAVIVLVGCGSSVDIYKAATKGDITTIKQYLDAGNDVDAKGEAEWTVLMYAANNGRKEIAELLIAKGADVNFMDESGHTPLYAAAIDGHREIAELLIAKGADVNAKDSIGMTALDWALADIVDDKAATKKTADLLRKHGGKTGEELEAKGK